MSDGEFEETRDFWNRVAADWRSQVGDDGDGNRVLNSDPVLWKFAGDVNRLTVLDAGCGTGYLSKKLRDQGARVTGIDFSERMIEIARTQNPDMDFRVDSCSELVTIDDEHFDMVIADIGLPDGSGLDLMRQLQKRHHLTGIALTGYGAESDLRLTREAGFLVHLTKPVNLTELEQALELFAAADENAAAKI